MLKLYEDASNSNINFLKAKPCRLEYIEVESMTNAMVTNFNQKLGVNFYNSDLDNSSWDKISKSIIKKSKSGTKQDFL